MRSCAGRPRWRFVACVDPQRRAGAIGRNRTQQAILVTVSRFFSGIASALAALVVVSPLACTEKETPSSTYFERTVSPVLTTGCSRTNTGASCHVADAKGNALGNLDTSTFAGVNKRRDLLVNYGPYGQPAFLLKNLEPIQVSVKTYDGKTVTVSTDIKHAGGSVLDATGSGYATLRRWLDNGATENNTGVPPKTPERQACSTFLPTRAFDLTRDPPRPDFAIFRDKVNGLLTKGEGSGSSSKSCAAANCHGTVANSLYLSCGDTPEQVRFNYYAAQEYLGPKPEEGELLRRPLSPAAGGAFHEGGILFDSPSDPAYAALSEWATAHGPAIIPEKDAGFDFFSQKVQPMLVKKGCMMIQCHSATMFHDYRLRGGSGGSFSLSATRRNYELSLAQMAVESGDVNASRLVRKNLYRPEVCSVAGCDKPAGITHRGGPLLEDFKGQAASPKLCADAKYDYEGGKLDEIPAYCVMGEWHRRERAKSELAPLTAIVYVKRPIGSYKRAQDFDVYAPGADLRRAPVTVGPDGRVAAGQERSLTAGCGLNVATADIQRPQVSWDGAKVAFAARSSAGEPLVVYEMNADGSACAKHPVINAGAQTGNGLLVHNFDPTYAPPENGYTRIVWASTRGNLPVVQTDYQGPQRQPADPTKPNPNLYVLEAGDKVRQLTFLLNMERRPSMMNDGRVIFPAEKRAPGFQQVALRRVNLDAGDYHPLYAQRGSIGYTEASEVVELSDKDFATIFREPSTPHGGGVLAVFNRSIGLDFRSTNPADYPIDPGVLDPAAPQSLDPQFFLRSLRFPDPSVDARPGKPTTGLYTSPSMLPDARILVSFGAASDPATFDGNYDLWIMNKATGQKERLLGEANAAEVEAVGVYGKLVRPVFTSALDEPNGHTRIVDGPSEATLHVLDLGVYTSLLFQNTPTGRILDPDLKSLEIWEDLPPPVDVDAFDKGGANVAADAFGKVYVRRRQLGTVPFEADSSAKFKIPGGVPIVFHAPDTALSREKKLPRWQREQFSFAPGEIANQAFKRESFGSLCGGCHNSVSGKTNDVALVPDFVTQASQTIARLQPPLGLALPPAQRANLMGPPQSP